MNKFILFLFLLSSTTIFSQMNFQKGYFIDENNHKVSCLIKNKDWINIPENFDYKLTENDIVQTINFKDLQEFRIFNTDLFYIKYKLDQDLKNQKNEVIEAKGNFIFLKVLLKGEGSLYEYFNDKSYFVYNLGDDDLKFLAAPIKKNKKGKIISDTFKSELYKNLKCDGFSVKTFKKLHYRQSELTKLFLEYNTCNGIGYDNFYNKRTKTKFRLKAIAGVNIHPSFSNEFSYVFEYDLPPSAGGGKGYDSDYGAINFDAQTNFSYGAEVEILLPLNRNKWSVFISPTYQKLSALSGSKEVGEHHFNYVIELSSISLIELPIGVRYYMNLDENTQVFTQLAMSTNLIISSDYSQGLEEIDSNFSSELGSSNKKNFNVFFGAGITYKKFALGVNYYFEKNIREGKNLSIDTKGAVSLFGSYTIF
ncbi:hypothetical protein [Winogradskyella psychrotolerans]|uniref:hypothetical protein n=1 Tax=Winogradskyella psychrotolerans TaxID=1344585 RepID=UPI001C07C16D|nr:hypothetical protein [Winogradskyella psychrotolerans]MBU2930175.1 hypothetical protein [Winogradskyella psychrotolerans]